MCGSPQGREAEPSLQHGSDGLCEVGCPHTLPGSEFVAGPEKEDSSAGPVPSCSPLSCLPSLSFAEFAFVSQ